MKAFLKKILVFIYHCMAKILPLSRKKAIFMSNMGRNYSGNPRAVYEEMLRDIRFEKLKKVWAFNGDFFGMVNRYGKTLLPKGCKIVRYGGLRYYFHMATAGIWVFDTRQEPYLVKRKYALYLMTWHGTPLKKLGLDMLSLNMSGEKRDLKAYTDSFTEESGKWDYLIAQNDFSASVFPGCFGYKGRVLTTGYPRNDRLVREGLTVREKAQEDTEVRKKVLLYAPTWRDDEYLSGGFYKCPSRPDFVKLEKALGDKYRIMLKLHYLVKLKKRDIPQSCIDSGFVKVYGNEIDISSLYLKADALIGDYTSAIFDYSVLDRPMFFFCYDLEKYRDSLRGFYMNLEEIAPGPISGNEEELIADIKETFEGAGDGNVSGRTDDREKLKKFRETYNKYDDGHASQRVLDVINRFLEEPKSL